MRILGCSMVCVMRFEQIFTSKFELKPYLKGTVLKHWAVPKATGSVG